MIRLATDYEPPEPPVMDESHSSTHGSEQQQTRQGRPTFTQRANEWAGYALLASIVFAFAVIVLDLVGRLAWAVVEGMKGF